MKYITIFDNGEYMKAYENGNIERKDVKPSESWKLTGAVRYSNFGYVVERLSFDEIFGADLDWYYKNGKQKWHLTDLDHGTHRIWGGRKHHLCSRIQG